MATATKEKSGIPARILSAYKTYVVTGVGATEAPMPLADFVKSFDVLQAQKDAKNSIQLSTDAKEYMELRGLTMKEYTPENGPYAGRKAWYLVGQEINVESTGFMRMDIERFQKTLVRMAKARIAMSVLLGQISFDEAMEAEKAAGLYQEEEVAAAGATGEAAPSHA